MSRHIAETAAKEEEYARNQITMTKFKDKMRIYRWILEFGNIVLCLFSFGYTYLWFSLHKFAITFVTLFLAEEIGTVNFPVFVITAVIGPVLLVVSFCADAFHKKRLLFVNLFVCFLLLVLLFINFVTGYEPVKLHNFIAFEIIMLIEVIATAYFIGVMGIDEELKKKDGYPDFNFNVSEKLTEEQQKYTDWYNARQRGEYTSSNKVKEPVTPVEDFGMEALLPDEDYVVEDIRKKPL